MALVAQAESLRSRSACRIFFATSLNNWAHVNELIFGRQCRTVATPLLLVVAVNELPKLALAPESGAVNVTVTPLTGLVDASRTVACRAVANAVLIAVLCGVPAVAVTLPLETLSAAAFNVTLPSPDDIFHLTFSVCPSLPAR